MAGDARFQRVHSDPRFRRARRQDTQVVLDERFKDVLGKGAKQPDRYGRHRHVREADDLAHLYRLDSPSVDYARGEGELESSSEEEEEEEEDDSDGDVVIGGASAVRRATQQDDESEASIDLDEEIDEDVAAELDREARTRPSEDVARGDDTRRLAVVNMDWDHVRAIDLFKVFSSLVSPHATRDPLAPVSETARGAHAALAPVRGQVLSVRVYLSDFGRERLAREDVQGPPRAIFQKREAKKAAKQVDEGNEFDEEALRQYQLERLRYYYAVATFDSAACARHVYNEIDGTEMERSANMFDLRFVPDDMALPDGEDGREAGYEDEATEDAARYEPLDYKTDALRHSRVRLTWDQDDPRRVKLTRAANRRDLHEDDLKTYLASSDEDDEAETAEQSKSRLRSLLTDLPKRSAFDDADDTDSLFAKPEGDMQVSFVPALSADEPGAADHEETTIEKYRRKQRERRERRREASAARAEASAEPEPSEPAEAPPEPVAEVNSDDEQHFNLEDIVRTEKLQGKSLSRHQRRREARRAEKRAALVQPSFQMDVHDPRFAAVHEDHHFAIDPSHPSFVQTAGMRKLMQASHERTTAETPASDLSTLVSSVKRRVAAPPRKRSRS
ncbi:pre-rRNA-processing protein esf1 [Malassezia caprae]|uniref:Pre-rRNA-processing protein esf1 n=1 Tax=Malassezia caprae TaxID=1381934 RepID=A0AAF0E7B1_9BASI|nr:pre-rRNA-processing protein esf1 [Malassezia caprae]